jgi:hypothetical protein
MSLLVREDDFIPITVYYTSTTNSKGVTFVKVLEEKKAKEWLADPGKSDKVRALNTKWKQQTWSAQQQLFANSNSYNPVKGQHETDWTLFSDQQLKTCLIDWDMTDEEGRVYPVSPEIIDNLCAPVANELLFLYRRAIMLDDEDAGN